MKDWVGGAHSTHSEMRSAFEMLLGKPEGKRPLGRPGHRWEDSINMVISEIYSEGVDLIRLAKDWDLWVIQQCFK